MESEEVKRVHELIKLVKKLASENGLILKPCYQTILAGMLYEKIDNGGTEVQVVLEVFETSKLWMPVSA